MDQSGVHGVGLKRPAKCRIRHAVPTRWPDVPDERVQELSGATLSGALSYAQVAAVVDEELTEEEVEEALIRREQIERSLAMLNERERHCLMLRSEGLSYHKTGSQRRARRAFRSVLPPGLKSCPKNPARSLASQEVFMCADGGDDD